MSSLRRHSFKSGIYNSLASEPNVYSNSGNSENSGSFMGSYSGSGSECCPLVIDPLTFISLLSFIGLAAYFLNDLIAMSNLMVRRKRDLKNVFNEGENYKIWFIVT